MNMRKIGEAAFFTCMLLVLAVVTLLAVAMTVDLAFDVYERRILHKQNP